MSTSPSPTRGPLVPKPYDLRASDVERETVVEALREHAAVGRIDADELEQRLERAYAAQLRADLLPLVADLPPAEAPSRPRRVSPVVTTFAPVILLAVVLVAIWALTGAGYFWPVWPIGGVAIATLKQRYRHAGPPVWLPRAVR